MKLARHPRLLAVVAVCAVAVGAASAEPALAAPSAGVVGSTVLVRPADAPAATSQARLLVSRNEFESLQVVVRADGAPLTGVDVTVTGVLTAPGGASIPASAFTTYRVGYYVATGLPSDGELGGVLGAFPDSLIPRVDPVWGEPRNAFPIDVPAGQNRLAWIDLLVPADAVPGIYSGASVRVTAAGGFVRTIPIEVEVVDLTLPSTTTLDGGFDMNPNKLCQSHDCARFPGGSTGLAAMYTATALDNRLSLAKPPNSTPSGPADASYRQYTRPLLAGTAPTRLVGARLRTVTIYQWAVESADEWRRTAEADGFVSRVRFHCDEIATSTTAWTACRNDWTRANALWRGAATGVVTDLPLQVTTSIDDVEWARTHGFAEFAERIAVLIPVINRVHPSSIPAFPGRRTEFEPWAVGVTPGGAQRRLWSYTSCMSMGCSPAAPDLESEWVGWPSYGVDQPTSEARAMGWTSWQYGLAGEYYYETTRDLPTAWDDLWSDDGGNHGDGTLFYPGTTARVGGTHDIAIESLRLKRIRDGREDYEWLRVASDVVGRTETLRIARTVFADAKHADAPQARIDSARTELARIVGGRTIRGIEFDEPFTGGDGAGTGGGSGAGSGGGGGGGGVARPVAPKPGSAPGARPKCGGRIATIIGTGRADVLLGTGRVDVIAGLGGNDTILGFGAGDVICGGPGNDSIVTARDSRARDLVLCGAGRDRLVHDARDRIMPGCERRTRGG